MQSIQLQITLANKPYTSGKRATLVWMRRGSVTQGLVLFCLKFIFFFNNSVK